MHRAGEAIRMDVLILGASARAAAQSARRAGLRPITVDLFADRDLSCIATAHRIDPGVYPLGFEEIADRLPPSPWMYTGALENHPDLIDRIAARRPLWGMSGPDLRAVRDPMAIQDALGRNGLPSLSVRLDPTDLPRDGSWLIKPLASAGGRRIRPLTGETPEHSSCYFQERIETEDQNYSFVYAGCERAVLPIGMTSQRIGRGDSAFAYRGSLGPISPSSVLRNPGELIEIGRVFWREFGAREAYSASILSSRTAVPMWSRSTRDIRPRLRSWNFPSVNRSSATMRGALTGCPFQPDGGEPLRDRSSARRSCSPSVLAGFRPWIPGTPGRVGVSRSRPWRTFRAGDRFSSPASRFSPS